MSEKNLEKARSLINRKKYDAARKILQPLAFENDEAKDLLDKLNSIAPEKVVVNKRGCLGCSGRTLMILVAVGIVIAIIAALGAAGAQKDAEEANQGKGTQENPIDSGETVIFDSINLSVVEIIRPADEMVRNFNMFNEESPEGADYVLVRFKLECKKASGELCSGNDFSVWLIDGEGNDWGEPFFSVLEEDLDGMEIVSGITAEGWQLFELPTNADLSMIRLRSGSTTLHVLP